MTGTPVAPSFALRATEWHGKATGDPLKWMVGSWIHDSEDIAPTEFWVNREGGGAQIAAVAALTGAEVAATS